MEDSQPAEKHLTRAELGRLFRVISDARDRAIFVVSYFRGLRASEVKLLQLAAYDRTSGRLTFKRLKRSDGGKPKLSPMEVKALNAWLKVRGQDPGPLFPSNRGKGISRQMLDVLMRRYGAEAGIPEHKRHFHCLKHSIATHLVEKGVEILRIKGWLGHRSINSTLAYTHLSQSEQDAIAERLYVEW
jgi:site-specific recombinase XerD